MNAEKGRGRTQQNVAKAAPLGDVHPNLSEELTFSSIDTKRAMGTTQPAINGQEEEEYDRGPSTVEHVGPRHHLQTIMRYETQSVNRGGMTVLIA